MGLAGHSGNDKQRSASAWQGGCAKTSRGGQATATGARRPPTTLAGRPGNRAQGKASGGVAMQPAFFGEVFAHPGMGRDIGDAAAGGPLYLTMKSDKTPAASSQVLTVTGPMESGGGLSSVITTRPSGTG